MPIKTFVGTSSNAVLIQIWTALIALLILKYLKAKSKANWSLSNLVAMLRYNLLTYRNLWEWIDCPYLSPPEEMEIHQLSLLPFSIEQQVMYFKSNLIYKIKKTCIKSLIK